MANLLYANNAAGTLLSGLTNVSASLTLNAGQGAAFPSPVPPQVFYVTLTDAATQTLIEIVKVTAKSGDVFSITRAQDGTSALSWNAGDIVSQRTIALELRGFENAAEGNFAAQNVAVTPSTTLGIVGTASADNANTGSVGEYLQQAPGAFPIGSGGIINSASLSVTAGDWDVSGTVIFQPTGTFPAIIQTGVNNTSATFSGVGTFNELSFSSAPVGNAQTISTPVVRFNLAAPGTFYLVSSASFSGGSMTGAGLIRARRVR
jgi:hypothetical protein